MFCTSSNISCIWNMFIDNGAIPQDFPSYETNMTILYY